MTETQKSDFLDYFIYVLLTIVCVEVAAFIAPDLTWGDWTGLGIITVMGIVYIWSSLKAL